jgi:SSS family solute:Na+ symporter
MSTLDWILTIAPMFAVFGIALYTRRFVKSVADFLAGGRCAGRYLIANAYGESASGVANTMSKFEMILVAGFIVGFWETLSIPIKLFIASTGFVVYRYRQTRAMTLAQFFEMRYSHRFRLFMGMLAFVAGILNYGVFPAISAKFFVYFMGLPITVTILGMHLPTTVLIMASYLTCVVLMLTTGGQITLMVTDCVEGLFSLVVLLVVIVVLYLAISWPHVAQTLANRPAQNSMLNPFDAWQVSDFNIAYVAMALAITLYGTLAVQNTQGFNAAARSPHESRMAGILGNWRLNTRIALLTTIGVVLVTFLRHPDFAHAAEPANKLISSIPNPQIRKQMTLTAALRYLLPPGIKGLFCSTMIMGLLAGDCSHMHSWSSIFVQDVILPLRRRPLSTRAHLWVLRGSIIFVALFALTFSILFTQTQYIALWWQITNAIFVSGAGAAIIGGLYWRKGTTGGAWSAVFVGSALALGGILLNQYWTQITPWWNASYAKMFILPAKFWMNGIQVAFVASLAATVVYIVVSYLTCRVDFNLDQMLHRGKYTPPAEQLDPERPRPWLARLTGVDYRFTRSDRWIATLLVGWSLLVALINGFVVLMNSRPNSRWMTAGWSRYWLIFGVGVPFVIGLATTVWFTIGGVRDLRDFFRALRTVKRDASDDGRVEVSGDDRKQAALEGHDISNAAQGAPALAPSHRYPGERVGERG